MALLDFKSSYRRQRRWWVRLPPSPANPVCERSIMTGSSTQIEEEITNQHGRGLQAKTEIIGARFPRMALSRPSDVAHRNVAHRNVAQIPLDNSNFDSV